MRLRRAMVLAGLDKTVIEYFIECFSGSVHEWRMIIRHGLIALLGIILCACGQGGLSSGASQKVSEARERNDGPALWVAKDYDSTVYLFGTVHLLPDTLSWLRDDVKAAFNAAGTIYFEVDTGTSGQIQASVLTNSLGFRKDGLSLSSQLDSYQHKLLEAAAHNGELSLAALNSMKPWLASEFLTIAAASNAGLSPELSADAALKSRAQNERKNVLYFETMEQQIRLAADQPDFVQLKLLTETLEGFNTLGSDLKKIVSAWSVGQTDYLTREVVMKMKEASPDFYKALMSDRNRRWADVLTRYMEDSGTAFVAVGVGHLLGGDSLIEQLRERGYKVSRYYDFQGENVIRPVEATITRPKP